KGRIPTSSYTGPVWTTSGRPPKSLAPIPAAEAGGAARISVLRLARILDRLERVEFHVLQHAVHAFDLADVDVLGDVARLRIDFHRTTRAHPFHAFHRGHERITLGIALGFLQRLVDQAHAIVGSRGDHVRTHARIGFLVS